MSKENSPFGHLLRRRTLLLAGGAGGLAAAALAIQSRHQNRAPLSEPDGRFRQILVSWPSPATDLVLIAARARGIFASYSLDIQTIDTIMDGNQAISLLQSGKVTAAVAPALSWLPFLQEGLQARLTMGIAAGTFRMLVRKGSGISRTEGLVGKTIALLDTNTADQRFFMVLMRRKGIDVDNAVHWVKLPEADIVTAAKEGRIDAVAAHDPMAWRMLSENGDLFSELMGSTTGHYVERVNRVVGLSDSFLQGDLPGAVALVMALRDSCRWIEAHRDEVKTLLAEALPDMELDAVGRMLDHEAAPLHLAGTRLRDQIAQYTDELKLIGLLPESLDSATFARQVFQNMLKS